MTEMIERFFYPEGETESIVRVKTIEDKNWFCAKDVCNILDISNSKNAITRLDNDEKIQFEIYTQNLQVDTTDPKKRTLNFVSEAGLYELIFTSRKEEAKHFRKWVFSEVLPQIRKTGKYESNDNAIQKYNHDYLNCIKGLLESNHIREHIPEAYFLAKDILVQNLQGRTHNEVIRIKDISQHMLDLHFKPSTIRQFSSSIGKYIKKQFIIKYGFEPPLSDKDITHHGKKVIVPDFHNGANRAVCWYAPEYYNDVRSWIKEYFQIKHPELLKQNTIVELIE
jgi:prophage antirepressor-like protein